MGGWLQWERGWLDCIMARMGARYKPVDVAGGGECMPERVPICTGALCSWKARSRCRGRGCQCFVLRREKKKNLENYPPYLSLGRSWTVSTIPPYMGGNIQAGQKTRKDRGPCGAPANPTRPRWRYRPQPSTPGGDGVRPRWPGGIFPHGSRPIPPAFPS